MPMRLLTFVERCGTDLTLLKACVQMGEKPVWLSREQIIGGARSVIPWLPDDSHIMTIEAWGEFPRGAIAVIPPPKCKGKHVFAISKESVEVTNPKKYRDKTGT